MKKAVLSNNHWRVENYRQRMTTKEWRELLLNEEDHIIFKGHMRHLKAKPIGAGVVEVFKEPIKE